MLSGLYTREFNEICSVHPVFKAHLRCAFLIMSWRTSRQRLAFTHALLARDGAGDHALISIISSSVTADRDRLKSTM